MLLLQEFFFYFFPTKFNTFQHIICLEACFHLGCWKWHPPLLVLPLSIGHPCPALWGKERTSGGPCVWSALARIMDGFSHPCPSEGVPTRVWRHIPPEIYKGEALMAKGCRWPEVENLLFAVFGEIKLHSARRIVREDPLSQQKGHGRGLFLQHRSTKNNCISSLYLVYGYWPQRSGW